MRSFVLCDQGDADILHRLHQLVSAGRRNTAEMLAHIAEVDGRRLYLAAGYPNMFAHCLGELRFSEDATFKRIQAARVGHRYPVLFEAIEDGRLHLTAVCLIAPHLTKENVEEFMQAATHATKQAIQLWLARRFAQFDLSARQEDKPTASSAIEAAPAQLNVQPMSTDEGAPVQVFEPPHGGGAPGLPSHPVGSTLSVAGSTSPDAARTWPDDHLSTIVRLPPEVREKLDYARALLRHAVQDGDHAKVIDRALDTLIDKLEKRKFAATDRTNANEGIAPRAVPAAGVRKIPAAVRRAVSKRDAKRCTFVGDTGHRCDARSHLEFDHVVPIARGGRSTVEGLRLRCRAHNQFEAERLFGRNFMESKREQSKATRTPAEDRADANRKLN